MVISHFLLDLPTPRLGIHMLGWCQACPLESCRSLVLQMKDGFRRTSLLFQSSKLFWIRLWQRFLGALQPPKRHSVPIHSVWQSLEGKGEKGMQPERSRSLQKTPAEGSVFSPWGPGCVALIIALRDTQPSHRILSLQHVEPHAPLARARVVMHKEWTLSSLLGE